MLRTLGAAAVGGAVASTTVSAGHGGSDAWQSAQPDHVSIDFPSDLMDRYRPAMDLPDDREERSRFLGLHGWRAQSDEFDGDWYAFWSVWTNQEGTVDATSHQGDHEPCYIRISGNEPVEVIYSPYHWLREREQNLLPVEDGTHLQTRTVDTYHGWAIGADKAQTTLPDVHDLRDSFGDWLDNGLANDLRVGAVHNPPLMRTASSWWQDTIGGFVTESLWRAQRPLGLGRPGGLL